MCGFWGFFSNILGLKFPKIGILKMHVMGPLGIFEKFNLIFGFLKNFEFFENLKFFIFKNF